MPTDAERNRWRDLAMQNNMDWYAAQAQSWQLPYQRSAHQWWSLYPVPPFHSNLVIYDDSPGPRIAEISAVLEGAWSIKDAKRQFDLQPLGFNVLFDAHWYARRPGIWPASAEFRREFKISEVHSAEMLTAWLHAWGETPAGATIFVRAILTNPNVHMLYAERHGNIVAGLCANASTSGASRVLGITNTFGSSEGIDACLAHVANNNASSGIVGYDRQQELSRLEPSGFFATGPLRVWHKP